MNIKTVKIQDRGNSVDKGQKIMNSYESSDMYF